MSARNGEGLWTRDVARGPMPWTGGHLNGFSEAAAAWLDTVPLPPALTVEHQLDDPASTWHAYRRLIGLRKAHPSLWQAPFELVRRDGDCVVVRRGELLVAANLGGSPVTVPELQGAVVLYESLVDALTEGGAVLAGESTVVARGAE